MKKTSKTHKTIFMTMWKVKRDEVKVTGWARKSSVSVPP